MVFDLSVPTFELSSHYFASTSTLLGGFFAQTAASLTLLLTRRRVGRDIVTATTGGEVSPSEAMRVVERLVRDNPIELSGAKIPQGRSKKINRFRLHLGRSEGKEGRGVESRASSRDPKRVVVDGQRREVEQSVAFLL